MQNIAIQILNTLRIITVLEFEELDDETRRWMLFEFEKEESSDNPYRSSRLNSMGKEKFQEIMQNAISSGDISSLTNALSNRMFWNATELCITRGIPHTKRVPSNAVKLLAHTEFTTWYTRGFARRLMEENVDLCEIYRAEKAQIPRCECTRLEGTIINVKKIYDGHRAKYHPRKNPSAFSIPNGANCHHTIRRIAP